MTNLNETIRYPIVLDISHEKIQSIDIMQGNKDSISLDIYINDNGNPAILPPISDKIKYCLESSRPDSEQSPIEKEASSVNGNVVTFECIDEYISSYPGQIYCIISIYNSSTGKVHKLPYGFYINIIDSPFNEDGVVHSDEFSVLSKLIIDSMDLKDQVSGTLDRADNTLNECNEAITDCRNATQECITKIGICEDKTVECVNVTNDCEELTKLVQMKLGNGDFKGDPGVITTIDGQVAFQIENGDLILYYTGNEAPNYSIDENGCLIFTF